MRWALPLLFLASACELQSLEGPDDEGSGGGGAALCEGTSRAALTAADRKIIGDALPYEADGTLRGRDEALAKSQRLRREVAWKTVAKILAPSPLALELPSLPGNTRLPLWQTWYGREELARVFHRAYGALSPEAKKARALLDEPLLEEAFTWNARVVDELPSWPTSRFDAYLDAIDTEARANGLGGVGRVGYAPAAARHLLSSYHAVLDCRDEGAPPAHAEGPLESAVVLEQRFTLDTCETDRVGPFAVLEDEVLRAEHSGSISPLEIEWRDALSGRTICRVSDPSCSVRGPGSFYVGVAAEAVGGEGTITVRRESRKPAWSSCVGEPFPLDGAVVKADWRRADFGERLPVYDTSAEALSARTKGGRVSWSVADGDADPGPESIFTLTTESGAAYRLAGLHLMTKELDHWMWVSLFWSPNPNDDFGADRPADITALEGPWKNYKMCVVTAFDEGDPDPEGGFANDAPSLAAALKSIHTRGGASWCSNPYIERGDGNAATNCVGCHQHGGTGNNSESILADPIAYPDHGRMRVRNNFPTDYSWALEQGDSLGQLFADEETFFSQE